MTGEGEPFPDGATPYAGSIPSGADAMARIADLERDLADLVAAVAVSLERFTAETPSARRAVAADLRVKLSRPGRSSAVLSELLRAIERAAPYAAPGAAGKKRQHSRS